MASDNISKIDAIGENKIDATNSLWKDQRDKDQGGADGVVALDGSDPGRNAFESQGSDAHARSAGNGETLPPWAG